MLAFSCSLLAIFSTTNLDLSLLTASSTCDNSILSIRMSNLTAPIFAVPFTNNGAITSFSSMPSVFERYTQVSFWRYLSTISQCSRTEICLSFNSFTCPIRIAFTSSCKAFATSSFWNFSCCRGIARSTRKSNSLCVSDIDFMGSKPLGFSPKNSKLPHQSKI